MVDLAYFLDSIPRAPRCPYWARRHMHENRPSYGLHTCKEVLNAGPEVLSKAKSQTPFDTGAADETTLYVSALFGRCVEGDHLGNTAP